MYLNILYKLISSNIFYIPQFITQLFDKIYNICTNIEEKNVLLFDTTQSNLNKNIIEDSQYNESKEKYKTHLLLKTFTKIIYKISLEPQYGEGIINLIKSDIKKYYLLKTLLQGNKNIINESSNIWRRSADSKEHMDIIYTHLHNDHFYPDSFLSQKFDLNSLEYKLPMLPNSSILFVDTELINSDSKALLNQIISNEEFLKKQE